MLNGPLINIGRRSTARCHNRFQQTHSFSKPEYANIPLYEKHSDTINRRELCVITAALYNCDSIKSNYFAYIWHIALGLPTLCGDIRIDEIVHIDYALFFSFKVICEYMLPFVLQFHAALVSHILSIYGCTVHTYRVSLILLFCDSPKTCQSIIYIIATKHINRFTLNQSNIWKYVYLLNINKPASGCWFVLIKTISLSYFCTQLLANRNFEYNKLISIHFVSFYWVNRTGSVLKICP